MTVSAREGNMGQGSGYRPERDMPLIRVRVRVRARVKGPGPRKTCP